MTINLETSEEAKNFLKDKRIKNLVKVGNLTALTDNQIFHRLYYHHGILLPEDIKEINDSLNSIFDIYRENKYRFKNQGNRTISSPHLEVLDEEMSNM